MYYPKHAFEILPLFAVWSYLLALNIQFPHMSDFHSDGLAKLSPWSSSLFWAASHLLTLRGATYVSGGTSVGGALGVLGEGILPGPVKIVCQVLGVATDLLILKVAGVVCSQGRVGREWDKEGQPAQVPSCSFNFLVTPEAAPKHPSSGSRILRLQKPGNRAPDTSVPGTGLLNPFGATNRLMANEVKDPITDYLGA